MHTVSFKAQANVVHCVRISLGLQPGQLPAAGSPASIGVSLDTDDTVGETNQDWGEGCVPFPEDRFPDGGLEKVLVNPWCRKKIMKKPHASCGLETKWEMSNDLKN
jgi:hypothetical protein